MADLVLTSRDGAIVAVLLNRPERLNALGLRSWQELGDALADLAADDEIRCIVLRGADGRAFASGADIGEFEAERSDPDQAKAYDRVMRRALTFVRDSPHPVIAAIEGPCIGAGLALAANCDVRICATGSRFGVPVSRLGLPMPYPEIESIQRLVGPGWMAEILLEARIFGAEEALAMGLVNRVVPDDCVADEAMTSARRIAAGAPLVNRWHRRFIRRLLEHRPLTEAELEECYAFFATEDYREGLDAFKAKRPPDFKGR